MCVCVEKIKALSVSLIFSKGSKCSVFSDFIPLFPRFLFPLGARTFSIPIGHLFPIFGAELKWYLSRNSYVPTQRCTFTAVVRKIPRSFCQKCRWQVTAKHAYTLRMWLCMK